jgi:hypothetical protein
VTSEQHRALMVALGELQATLDGIALDAQAIREHVWGVKRAYQFRF